MKTYLVILAAMMPLLSACNTVEGFGQDMQQGGQNIEEAAEDNK